MSGPLYVIYNVNHSTGRTTQTLTPWRSTRWEKHVAKNGINIYSSAVKRLPFPQHIVFYNGTREEPDRMVLRLSDLFEADPEGRRPALECETVMLNIN